MASSSIGSVGKSLIAAAVLAGLVAPPAAAQQQRPQSQASEQPPGPTEQDELRRIANNVNAQRDGFFATGETAAAANIYTADADFIELQPVLMVYKGRRTIEEHFKELLRASIVRRVTTVTSADMHGRDTMLIAGDYSLLSKDGKQINAHFVQQLRREGGVWKIALQVFARPRAITVGEVDQYRGNQ